MVCYCVSLLSFLFSNRESTEYYKIHIVLLEMFCNVIDINTTVWGTNCLLSSQLSGQLAEKYQDLLHKQAIPSVSRPTRTDIHEIPFKVYTQLPDILL